MSDSVKTSQMFYDRGQSSTDEHAVTKI